MNSYSIFAIVLTVAYLIYYAAIVAHDLYGKKKMCKTSEEVFDLGEPEEEESIAVSDSETGFSIGEEKYETEGTATASPETPGGETLFLSIPYAAFAKSGSVNYSWGADALATMHDFVVTMMLYVQLICCSIAGILVIVSGFQIYVKMNTGEDGITKSIVTLVGACLFLIGAFFVFPAFFGYRI